MLSKKCSATQSFDTSKYLIPWFDGAICSLEWKEAFWDKWTTGAPRTVPHSPTNLRDRDGPSPWICVRSGPRTPNSAARTSNDGVPTCFVLVRALGTLDNLCHCVPLELICKPNSLTYIRLSLVPKRTKQVSGKLVALQPLNSCYRVTSQCEARLTLFAWFSVTH
jgi:hypothetical protein